MDSAIGLIVGLIFSAACLIAFLVGMAILFPSVNQRTKLAADRTPGRSFLVGLVNLLFFGSVALGFLALSDSAGTQFFMLPALLILGALIVGISGGLAGVVSMAGERMSPDRAPWSQSMAGGILLTLACLTPVIGWFILFPFLGCVGLGAYIIGWFRRG